LYKHLKRPSVASLRASRRLFNASRKKSLQKLPIQCHIKLAGREMSIYLPRQTAAELSQKDKIMTHIPALALTARVDPGLHGPRAKKL